MPLIRQTPRLQLRALQPIDAEAVLRLGGDPVIAETMISVPHPLPRAIVEEWIACSEATNGSSPHRYFAAVRSADQELVGVVALRHIDREHLQAELSFWIGRPHWGQGLAVEAAAAIVGFAFEALGVNRLEAYHMVRNPASGHVLQRMGFEREGVLRERVRRAGRFEDVVICALLRSRFRASGG
jgi:ribosomal-protein-alanine N-acetyltransferase